MKELLQNAKAGNRTTAIGGGTILGIVIASLIIDYAPNTTTGAFLTEYAYIIGPLVGAKLVASVALILKGKK